MSKGRVDNMWRDRADRSDGYRDPMYKDHVNVNVRQPSLASAAVCSYFGLYHIHAKCGAKQQNGGEYQGICFAHIV